MGSLLADLGKGRPPRGGRGLKLSNLPVVLLFLKSPPSRGAWIEIDNGLMTALRAVVAPLAGGVD